MTTIHFQSSSSRKRRCVHQTRVGHIHVGTSWCARIVLVDVSIHAISCHTNTRFWGIFFFPFRLSPLAAHSLQRVIDGKRQMAWYWLDNLAQKSSALLLKVRSMLRTLNASSSFMYICIFFINNWSNAICLIELLLKQVLFSHNHENLLFRKWITTAGNVCFIFLLID